MELTHSLWYNVDKSLYSNYYFSTEWLNRITVLCCLDSQRGDLFLLGFINKKKLSVVCTVIE